jgi:predicted ATPase
VRIEKLVFAGGATPESAPLELHPTSITIFLGPNNGGKSTALREIHSGMFSQVGRKVVVDSRLAAMDENEIKAKVVSLVLGTDPNNLDIVNFGRRGSSSQIHSSTLRAFNDQPVNDAVFNEVRRIVLPHFAMNLSGEARLSLTTASGAQKMSDRPQSTIAAIFKDDALRSKISKVIYDAFDQHLVIDATQLGTLSYAFSTDCAPKELERSFTDEAIAFFERTEPLAQASDGTRAFVGVITEVLAGEADVIFIDEPEAFLHPGLAYALGREVALNVNEGKQLFAATHSPQFLMGCLSAGTDINVVRLSRRDGQMTVNLLDSNTLSRMMSEPLLRSSNVISGLFYNAAIVVEGDSDRSFYEEINLRLDHEGKGIKHPVFINSHSKQTAPEISRTLRHAGVPTAMILDLDWLKEGGTVQAKYFAGMGLQQTSWHSVSAARSQTRQDLEATGKNYKREGGLDLLTGGARASADDFLDHMAEYGLFTVRRGELEAWLSNLPVSRAKQGWLEVIFGAMGNDRTAVGYAHPSEGDVWDFIQDVSRWIGNNKRKGMPNAG